MHEDVGGFDVSVDYIVLVEALEPTDDFLKNFEGFRLAEMSFLFEEFGEIAVVAVLEEDIEIIGSSSNMVHGDNVLIFDFL